MLFILQNLIYSCLKDQLRHHRQKIMELKNNDLYIFFEKVPWNFSIPTNNLWLFRLDMLLFENLFITLLIILHWIWLSSFLKWNMFGKMPILHFFNLMCHIFKSELYINDVFAIPWFHENGCYTLCFFAMELLD